MSTAKMSMIKAPFAKASVLAMIPLLAASLLLVSPASAGAGDANGSGSAADRANNGTVQAHPADKPSAGKDMFVKAMKEDGNKNYAGAVEYYTKAIDLNPHYGEAYGNRGASRFNMKDYNGALSDYNEALKYFPNNKALIDLKEQAVGALREAAAANQAARNQANFGNQTRAQMMLGGDMSDPATILMMNAQRRGLITQPAVDYSDPASIIMMNARKRGLVPANTPSP